MLRLSQDSGDAGDFHRRVCLRALVRMPDKRTQVSVSVLRRAALVLVRVGKKYNARLRFLPGTCPREGIQNPKDFPRTFSLAERVHFLVTHLSLSAAARARTLTEVGEWARKLLLERQAQTGAPIPVVLVGDMNAELHKEVRPVSPPVAA